MVAEVEDRIRHRDELNGQRLGKDLHDLRVLLQSKTPLLPSEEHSLQSDASENRHSSDLRSDYVDITSGLPASREIPDNEANSSLSVAHTESRVSTFDDTSQSGTSSTEAKSMRSSHSVNRDFWYAGVGGSILGAAAVTVWHAVFH